MLVVNRHTLQTINFLDFVDDVLRQLFHTLQPQDVMSTKRSVTDGFTAFHLLAVEYANAAPFRNQCFNRITARWGDNQATFALGFFTEGYDAGRLRKNCRLLRLPSFEQVSNSRQTTSDVTGLGTFLRNSRDDVTDADFTTVLHVEDRIAGHEVVRWHIAAWQIHGIALGIIQAYCGT